GRDWRASNIEEVTVRVEASDDFGLDRVELRYSVNGGEWQTARIDAEGKSVIGSQVIYLEDLRQEVRPRPAALNAIRERTREAFQSGIDELIIRRARPQQTEPQ